ncbi:aminopeptidase N [Lewinella marina]|uniref:Aminopeptidase N n=1 Tax=Neolewinella marina TaxID=438751 RepID=A0A2G0CDZ7_9BACT|nr:M1 family aminopeptidase [Neolewinella marina]NJB87495.1 aminopeptidase N [Neolewinella marina]PHK98199.1 alanyl aminopeptidase [Neolewinella marina]
MYRSAILSLLATLLLAASCNTTRPAVATVPTPTESSDPTITETRNLDTMTVRPSTNGVITEEEMEGRTQPEVPTTLPPRAIAYNRVHDLLHTKLEISFDWEQEMVIGKATLRLKPIFRPSDELTLDAKNFTFNSITLANGTPLEYAYDDDRQRVTIQLDRAYTRGQEYTIVLDYTATPAASGTAGEAITSDKGLFFINPRGEEGDKPRQIWTQGETENNSRWFPTIDKPNERTTQELYVTVDDRYKTLSNGTLVSSKPAGNGKRTDYWKMDLPHAPYLFALVVGEFAVVEDEPWNGIPVNYYVEPKYRDHAEAIFPYTPEMLTFFSELTGVEYPWPKYSQVAVRDFVSGAMENTTAVIFGEFMNGTDRDLIDVDLNEKIVAHEMFHHWFGDLVTCESWAQLTLNEGFANYSEYLWMAEKHGKDAADYHLLEEWQGYFNSVRNGSPHELIWYDYPDKEDMFDAHSYNKGGAVLHMLRHYVGDEAFFNSLQHYLERHKFSAVEVDELRMAFEDTTGEDLSWFFDQWYLSAGHPRLRITTDYSDGSVAVTVEQTQSTDDNVPAVFKLPVDIDVYVNGTAQRHRVTVDQREQTFTFAAAGRPDVVVLDPHHQLLAEYDYQKSAPELAAQYRYAPAFLDRYEAVGLIGRTEGGGEFEEEVLTAALQDSFYAIRGVAVQSLVDPTPVQLERVRAIARQDDRSQVRAAALDLLTQLEDEQLAPIAREAMEARSYTVVAAGLQALVATDPEAATKAAAVLEEIDNEDISGALADLYSSSGDLTKLPFFESRLESVDGYAALGLYTAYQSLLAQGQSAEQTTGVSRLKEIALDQSQTPWRRLAATKAISDLRNSLAERVESMGDAGDLNKLILEMGTSLEAIKAAETNTDLQNIYQQF